jgi:outer membrane immunogenic protein
MVKLGRSGADTGAIQGRVGAKLTPNFGVEGEVAGGVDDDKVYTPGGPATVKMEHQVAGYAVGYLPVTPNIDLSWPAPATARPSSRRTIRPPRNSTAAATAGTTASALEYKFDDKNGMRADYTKSEYTKSDLSSNTVAVGYVRQASKPNSHL